MAAKNWNELTNDEKLDRLTLALTRAGSDIEFRDRCLVSPESAKAAISEVGEIDFPVDFRVQFVTPEEQLKTLILVIPEFRPTAEGEPVQLRSAEDFQPCSYNLWRA